MSAQLPHLLLEETGMDFTSSLESSVPKRRKLNAENSFASSDGDDHASGTVTVSSLHPDTQDTFADQFVDQNQHHAPHLDNTILRFNSEIDIKTLSGDANVGSHGIKNDVEGLDRMDVVAADEDPDPRFEHYLTFTYLPDETQKLLELKPIPDIEEFIAELSRVDSFQRGFSAFDNFHSHVRQLKDELKKQHPAAKGLIDMMPVAPTKPPGHSFMARPVLMKPLLPPRASDCPDGDPLLEAVKDFENEDSRLQTLLLRTIPGAGKSGAAVSYAKKAPHVWIQFEPPQDNDRNASGVANISGTFIDSVSRRYIEVLSRNIVSLKETDSVLRAHENYLTAKIVSQLHVLCRLIYVNAFVNHFRKTYPDHCYEMLVASQLDGGNGVLLDLFNRMLIKFLQPMGHEKTLFGCAFAETVPLLKTALPRLRALSDDFADENLKVTLQESNFRGPLYYMSIYALPCSPRNHIRLPRVILIGTRLRKSNELIGYAGVDFASSSSMATPSLSLKSSYKAVASETLRTLLSSLIDDDSLPSTLRDEISLRLPGRLRNFVLLLQYTFDGMLLSGQHISAIVQKSFDKLRFGRCEDSRHRLKSLFSLPEPRFASFLASVGHDASHSVGPEYPKQIAGIRFLQSLFLASFPRNAPAQCRAVHSDSTTKVSMDFEAFSLVKYASPRTTLIAPLAESAPEELRFAVSAPDAMTVSDLDIILVGFNANPLRIPLTAPSAVEIEYRCGASLIYKARGRSLRQLFEQIVGSSSPDWLSKDRYLEAVPLWYSCEFDKTTDYLFTLLDPQNQVRSLYSLWKMSNSIGPDFLALAPFIQRSKSSELSVEKDKYVLVVAGFSVCADRASAKERELRTKNKLENFYMPGPSSQFDSQVSAKLFEGIPELAAAAVSKRRQEIQRELQGLESRVLQAKKNAKDDEEEDIELRKSLQCSLTIQETARKMSRTFFTELFKLNIVGIVELSIVRDEFANHSFNIQKLLPFTDGGNNIPRCSLSIRGATAREFFSVPNEL